ncbi:hypothetical protein K439DRAFT_1638588 [Ramaria rubella]|nr:hypothetical protein K439DRAFT_1638588 [Ramaria rubella]
MTYAIGTGSIRLWRYRPIPRKLTQYPAFTVDVQLAMYMTTLGIPFLVLPWVMRSPDRQDV